jgi:hypothetical protein
MIVVAMVSMDLMVTNVAMVLLWLLLGTTDTGFQ